MRGDVRHPVGSQADDQGMGAGVVDELGEELRPAVCVDAPAEDLLALVHHEHVDTPGHGQIESGRDRRHPPALARERR